MNKEIEYFKRFAKSYMRWTHFNFDRIVADVVRKDREVEEERKRAIKLKLIADMLTPYNSAFNETIGEAMHDALFYGGSIWSTFDTKVKGARIGSVLKIRLPSDYHIAPPCN